MKILARFLSALILVAGTFLVFGASPSAADPIDISLVFYQHPAGDAADTLAFNILDVTTGNTITPLVTTTSGTTVPVDLGTSELGNTGDTIQLTGTDVTTGGTLFNGLTGTNPLLLSGTLPGPHQLFNLSALFHDKVNNNFGIISFDFTNEAPEVNVTEAGLPLVVVAGMLLILSDGRKKRGMLTT